MAAADVHDQTFTRCNGNAHQCRAQGHVQLGGMSETIGGEYLILF